MWPGTIPGLGVICGLSLLLVLVLVLRVFSPGTPVFPPSSKTNISKFQFDLEFEGHRFASHTRPLSVTLVKQRRFFSRVIGKRIFRRLENFACAHHFGVPLQNTNTAAEFAFLTNSFTQLQLLCNCWCSAQRFKNKEPLIYILALENPTNGVKKILVLGDAQLYN